MAFHAALLRMSLNVKGQLTRDTSWRALGSPTGEKLVQIALVNRPRRVAAGLRGRQILLADQSQHGGRRDMQRAGDFIDGQLAAILPLALAVGGNAMALADRTHTSGRPRLAAGPSAPPAGGGD